jgi:hypothetical protein
MSTHSVNGGKEKEEEVTKKTWGGRGRNGHEQEGDEKHCFIHYLIYCTVQKTITPLNTYMGLKGILSQEL